MTEMELALRSLTCTDMDILCRAFNQAFSNYQVPMHFSPQQLETTLRTRSVSLSLSRGLFTPEGELTAFLFAGVGQWEGEPAVYDAGTGVLPAWRGQGAAGRLVDAVAEEAGRRNCRRFVLEVLQDNEPAVKLYEKRGFVRRRELICLSGVPEGMRSTEFSVTAEPALPPEVKHFLNFPPAWQNDFPAIAAAKPEICALRENGVCTACAAVTASGNLMLLGVAPDKRRQGRMDALLSVLRTRMNGGKLSVANVDARDAETLMALTRRGLKPVARQFEMTRRLENAE
jgi:ribosomal protein S18 acetylase RimI-like enzyme